MNLKIDFVLLVGDDDAVDSAAFLDGLARYKGDLEDISALEGRLTVNFDGPNVCDEFADPVIRLVDSILRKLPWIIGGDTETVALRNSEQCFAFVPAGESVELSYFTGSETEIEDYIFEPVTVRLDAFVNQSIAMGERLLQIIAGIDPALSTDNEDAKDLQTSFDEAKRAWRDYLLHNRR